MCTLNMLECNTFETGETTMDTIAATADAASHAINTSTCKKCRSQNVRVLLRDKDRYCKTCFLSMVTHKFKATLGKSKSIRPTDTILVEHSGEANSTVLVHLIKANANESVNKRLKCLCKILYIDDGMVMGRTLEERKFIWNALAEEAESLQLPTYVVPLTECTTNVHCEEIRSINVMETTATSNDAIMQKIFNNLESNTAKDELLRQLKRKLIVSVARELNCNKAFVADTSLDLAVQVLTDVSTGRGCQLSVNVGFSDTRCTDVTLLKPLRDFTRDDVTGYLECCELTPIFSSTNYNQSFPNSIRSITKDFICQLDSKFHSTVSTIYRTSEKLGTKVEEFHNMNLNRDIVANADINDTCLLCELTLDSCYVRDEQFSVIQARIFSELVSTDSASNTTLNSGRTEEVNDSEKKLCRCDNTTCTPLHAQPLQPDIIEKYLCYGCRLIFLNSNKKFGSLPTFLHRKIQEKLQITHLRKEITDFLL
ncbi:cytoplasmic tRNA 2-thiolation protein 2 isoform X1 [Colletes gigas]|uniref:cytoplasmic tRNA 2-thiolation protein 2 isoform X1 n=2 Tax=Colletes gigas TaxID=935657 RepID=UPI001C9A91CE|nr:cytoplasmic tRNA 2-thiolation protein 2 isoform X1 [Colletes gigas]